MRSIRRLGVTLLSVALLVSGAFAISAEPASAVPAVSIITTSSDLTTVSGESVTFTVTVTGIDSTPTGTVNILDGVTPICSMSALAPIIGGAPFRASASCATTALSVATHSITGEYNGDVTYDPGTSPAISQVVSQASTTTTSASGTNPSAFGASVTFTANVAAVLPGSGPRTGTVAFQDNSVDIAGCAAQVLTSNTATCSTSALSVGTHPITAVYSGDANFTTSTSVSGSQVVNAIVTTTTISGAPNPSVFSGSVTLTSTVASGSGTPTGNVAFTLGGDDITGCAAQPLSGGTATCTLSNLPVAANVITAEYAGAGNFAPSTSGNLTQNVNRAATTSAVSSSDLTTTLGDPVTFTATIAPVSPATVTPTVGTVSFNASGFAISGCSAKALTGGVATCTTTSDPAGTTPITAVFSGDANFTTSTSAAIDQTVAKAATATALASNHNPSRSGQTVTFTATVTSSGGTPTGSVTFSRVKNDSSLQLLGTRTLASGVATFSTSALPVEHGDIVAAYATTANYLASTVTDPQTVSRSESKPFIVSSRRNSKLGKPVSFGIDVVAISPGIGTPTGLVALYRERANGSRQWIGRGHLRSGLTEIMVTDLPLGSYKIIAVYRGSTTFRASERYMTQTVTT